MEIRQSFLITSWDCKWQPLYGGGVEGGEWKLDKFKMKKIFVIRI